MIYMRPGASVARYQSVGFTGAGDGSQAVFGVPIDLYDIDDIKSARAVTHWADGKQDVVLLGKTGLSCISSKGKKDWGKADNAVLIIGLDPRAPDQRLLALLVSEGNGFGVQLVDLDKADNEPRGAVLKLPTDMKRKAVAAEFVRREPSVSLMVVMQDDDSLNVHVLSWKDFSSKSEHSDDELS